MLKKNKLTKLIALSAKLIFLLTKGPKFIPMDILQNLNAEVE